jgi:DnaJ-class molecular chaperone
MRNLTVMTLISLVIVTLAGCSTVKSIGNGALVATGAVCKGLAQADQQQQQQHQQMMASNACPLCGGQMWRTGKVSSTPGAGVVFQYRCPLGHYGWRKN